MDNMDSIHQQHLPAPENKATPGNIMGAIFCFLLSHIILLPAYYFYIIMLLFGGMAQIQSSQPDYWSALYSLSLGLLPLTVCFRFCFGFVRKNLAKQVHYLTYKWISIVWIFLLGLFSFVGVVPNNPVATGLDHIQQQKSFDAQWEETLRHLPDIQEKSPFYVADGIRSTISLFETSTGVYVQYESTEDTLAVHLLSALAPHDVQQKANGISFQDKSYDVTYLIRNTPPTGGQVAIHTTSYGGQAIVQVADQYYHCDNDSITLNPDSFSTTLVDTAHYIQILTQSLYDAVPINPMDDDTVIYGHLPYYDLFPSVDFDFPWVGYEIVDTFLPTPPESRLTGKASDQEGENLISSGAGALSETYLRGNDAIYTKTELVFDDFGEDIMYYFFLVHDGSRYVRASNYISITRAQYEAKQW